MKKNLFQSVLPITLAALLIFASSAIFGQGTKEKREISGFSEISISIDADVQLTQGDEEKLVLEGDKDVLEKIETEVIGNNLKIKYDNVFGFKNYKKVTVYITAKNIEEINIAGSANLEAKTSIKTSEIEFSVSGNGKINIEDLETDEIEASISGSGDIVLGGSKVVDELDISISGSGDLHAEHLEIKEAEIKVSGSGSCKVHVSGELKVAISGSGKVYYKGNPTVNANISGSGKVRTLH